MKLSLRKALWLLLLSSGAAFAQDCGTPAPDVSEILTCPNNEIGNLQVDGTDIKWYENAVGGAALHPGTPVTSAFSTYYVSQTVNGCESPRVAVNVSTYDIDNGISQFPQISCNPFPASQLPNLLHPNSRWYASPYDTQTIDPTVMIGNVTLYYAVALNGCETQRFPVYFIDVPQAELYQDADGDGYGNPEVTSTSCELPGGYATRAGDCDDTNEDVGNCDNIPFTQLSDNSCGVFLESFSQQLYIDEVEGATQYRVRIYDEEIDEVITISSASFNFYQFENARYARAYFVRVAAFVDGVWGEYGDLCGILTPLRGTTKIQDSQCGVTITDINTNIYADNVGGAVQYNFRVRNGSFEYIVETDVPWFKFSDVPGFNFGTTYTIDVSAFTNLGPVNFGLDCTVTTPAATTQIRASQCGATIAGFNTAIFAKTLSGATQYRFKVTSQGNTQIIETANPWFKLNQLSSYGYGMVYSVEVAALSASGTWSAYGPACTVSAPAASSQTSHIYDTMCGTTVNFTTDIFTTRILLAQAYRFRVSSVAGGAVTVDSSTNYFKLNQVPGYSYNTEYTIDVAVQLNGQWGDYGAACSVTTPAVQPVTKIRNADCGATIAGRNVVVYADRVAAVATYRFRVISNAGTQTIDRSTNYFKINQLTGIVSGETLVVDVMTISTNGISSAYGATCNVTLSASSSRMAGEETASKTKASGYPNPFIDGFAVSYETESAEQVNVSVFDMNGRQLETFTSQPSELAGRRFGSGYAAGIYNVVVTQGDDQKVLHVVKN